MIAYQVQSHLAIITLSSVKSHNRLNYDNLLKFFDFFDRADKDSNIRMIMIRAKGDFFCSGMDLSEFEKNNNQSKMDEAVDKYAQLLLRFYQSHKPIISLVQGDVLAGGVGIICASDIVVSTTKVTVQLSEVFFGLIPANVLPYLLSLRVSPQRARYLILTAKKLSAQDAFVYGIFDEVWEENQIEKKMKSLIKDMHRCSPKAFGEVKSFTRDIIYKSPEEIKSLAIAKLLALSKAAENKEAVNAFNQGEMPKWFSRFKTDQSLS